jgi:hypothetical protein
MNLDQRVIYQTTDISQQVNDFRTLTAPFVYTAGQYLYIGSVLPFNNLWIEMGTANVNASVASVDMWFGHQWVSAVDVIDETTGLTASGRLQWNTDLNKGWDLEQYSASVTGLPALSAVYNMYWLRLSWSVTFSAGTTLAYVGQKFSTDAILYSFYPDLDNSTIRTSFAAGKTTWNEQHFMAAEHIVRDLQKNGIIKSRSQIVDSSKLTDASCHKVAELIYSSLGDAYLEQLKWARQSYKEASQVKFFNVDVNGNGRLDSIERSFSTDFATR